MRHHIFYIVLAILFFHLSMEAQDMHYSQFYADPLRLNPAMSGNYNGTYRLGLNARQQWRSVTVPYKTISAYADFAYQKGRKQVNWMGSGLHFMYDRAGDADLSTLEIRGNIALHQTIGPNFYLSAGFGAAYVTKSANMAALYFGSQWNDSGFDLNLSSQETFATEQFSYMDLQGGAVFTYHFEDLVNVYGGLSMLHINRPTISFYGGEFKMGQRILAHIGSTINTPAMIGIEPAAYFTNERKAAEIVLGSNVTYNMGDDKDPFKIYGGLWYRFRNISDAIILLTGLQLGSNRLLLSYDINISSLKAASKGLGGLELSFVHTGLIERTKHTTIYCPRF